MTKSGVLFVDDESEHVSMVSELVEESLGEPVLVVNSVEDAVAALNESQWKLVVMDLFIPLGDHPDRVLGPRAARYQESVDHLGGLVLLEEIDRLDYEPLVIANTACVDFVLLEIFGDRVNRRVPKSPTVEPILLFNAVEELLAEL